MTESMPLITIIVAVLNGANTLQRCIDSVVEQTYPNKEFILMDGGSTDGTIDILRANNDKITYWESRQDRGISHAWNKALGHANGEWIIIFGSDDYFWKPNVLMQMVPHLLGAFPTYRVVYGQLAITTETGRTIEIRGEPWEKTQPRFPHMMNIPDPSVFCHRELFEVQGGFDESIRLAQYYELLLRESKSKDFLFVPDVIVTGMQYGGLSTVPSLAVRIMAETRQAQIKNGSSRIPPLEWVWAYTKAWFKYGLYSMLGEKRTLAIQNIYRRLRARKAVG